MGKHSSLGPSSASRWFECPGSVALSAGVKTKEKPSIFAVEGTVAHDLCEKLVTGQTNILELTDRIGENVKHSGFDIEITQDMVDACATYQRVTSELMDGLKAEGKPAPIVEEVEGRVCASSIDKDLWGTGDYILYQKGNKLYVVDFKYGKGVPVDVKENKQMAIYAVGAQDSGAGTAFDQVTLVIVQPRAPHKDGPVRYWTTPKDWMHHFRKELAVAVDETQKKDAELKAGDHCRWCKAKAVCPAISNAVQKQAQKDFAVMPADNDKKTGGLPLVTEMTPLKMAQALQWEKNISLWFDSLRHHVQGLLESGQEVPGYKLVKGRSNRKHVEGTETNLVARFATFYNTADLYEKPKLLSPAKLEKVVGKEEVAKLEDEGLIVKPEAKNNIAQESDPRETAVPSAALDFAEEVPAGAKSIWPEN